MVEHFRGFFVSVTLFRVFLGHGEPTTSENPLSASLVGLSRSIAHGMVTTELADL